MSSFKVIQCRFVLREPSHSISLLSFFIALCNQAVYYRNLMIFDGIDRR